MAGSDTMGAARAGTGGRFVWHPQAALYDPAGARVPREAAVPDGVVLPDRGAATLPAAFALFHQGREALVAPPAGAVPQLAPRAAGPATLLTMTGGAAPKIVRRTQASWLATFRLATGRWHRGAADRVAVLGAMHHSLALYGAVEALCLGAELHVLSCLRPPAQAEALAARRVRLLWATPTQLRRLAGNPALPLVRQVMIGGGALDAATLHAARAMFPNARLTAFYGASETSFVAMGEAGAALEPLPGVEVSIRDGAGQPLPAGCPGEIWVASPWLALGYAAPPAQGAMRRDGRFVSVGDLGHVTAEGALRVEGRGGRSASVADRLVMLDAVEARLRAVPGVREAFVAPVPDPLRRTALVAVVQSDDAGGLAALCRRAVGPDVPLRRVRVVPDWPVTASGKPDPERLARLADAAAKLGGSS